MQKKFAVTSVIKIYFIMWELCVQPDYDHFIPLTSQIRQISVSNQHFFWE